MDDISHDLKHQKFEEAILKAKEAGLDEQTIKILTKI